MWSLGQQVQAVAVGWLVYDITRDPLALGFIGLAGFVPAVPLSLLTGPVADRYDRRSIIIISCIVMALGALGLCYAAVDRHAWPIYGFVILIGAARSFCQPAGQAMISTLVPEDEFLSAVAWTNSIGQAATIIGPALGGLLFPFGALVPFIFACVVFALAAVLAALLRPAPPQHRREKVTFAMLAAGYRFIWSQPVIFGAVTLDLVAVLLGGRRRCCPSMRAIFCHGPVGTRRSALDAFDRSDYRRLHPGSSSDEQTCRTHDVRLRDPVRAGDRRLRAVDQYIFRHAVPDRRRRHRHDQRRHPPIADPDRHAERDARTRDGRALDHRRHVEPIGRVRIGGAGGAGRDRPSVVIGGAGAMLAAIIWMCGCFPPCASAME